jgi:hypothetical protein
MLLYALITTNFDWGIAVCYNSYGYKQNARLMGTFKHHFISDIPVVRPLYKKKKKKKTPRGRKLNLLWFK